MMQKCSVPEFVKLCQFITRCDGDIPQSKMKKKKKEMHHGFKKSRKYV